MECSEAQYVVAKNAVTQKSPQFILFQIQVLFY